MEDMKCEKCLTPINTDDIDYYNGCNEEGEDYCVVTYSCDCGKDYEFSQWGEIENKDEAIELFNDHFFNN